MLEAFTNELIQVAVVFLIIGYRMGRGVEGKTLVDVLVDWLSSGSS